MNQTFTQSIYRYLILFAFLFSGVVGLAAQTTLGPGDIAFTSLGTDDNDQFSFVLLTDVVANTTFVITDDEYDGSILNTGEGRLRVTFTQAFSCGSEFRIVSPGGTGGDFPNGTGYTLTDQTSGPTVFQFSTSGEGLIAFQDADANTNNPAVYLAALNSSGGNFGTANTPIGNTVLPPGLVDGQTAVSINNPPGNTTEFDNVRYLASATSSGTPTALATAINTRSNWETSNDTYGTPLTYGFTCLAACTDPVLTGLTPSPNTGICPGDPVTIMINGSLNDGTGWFLREGSATNPPIAGPANVSSFVVNPTETTTYFVTALNCSGSPVGASIVVTLNGVAADAGSDQFFVGGTATLAANNGAPQTGMWTVFLGMEMACLEILAQIPPHLLERLDSLMYFNDVIRSWLSDH